MKTLIVYYSMSDNTKYVADKISKKIDSDVLRLIPKKKYPNKGLIKFFWCGKSAVMGEMPELEDYDIDIAYYDRIIFGTPVWASSFVPPIRTFIRDNNLKDKKISVFVCYSGGGADKAIDKLKSLLDIDKFDNELILIDPKDKKSKDKDKSIENFIKRLNK